MILQRSSRSRFPNLLVPCLLKPSPIRTTHFSRQFSLHAHPRAIVRVLRLHFSLRVSVTTINELRAGVFRRQAECLKMARALSRLSMSATARRKSARRDLDRGLIAANRRCRQGRRPRKRCSERRATESSLILSPEPNLIHDAGPHEDHQRPPRARRPREKMKEMGRAAIRSRATPI
jgi:hypothetical protein